MRAQTGIVVVGAGPAGINAAIAAAESGAKVTLIDGYPRTGGQYYKQMPDEFRTAAPREAQGVEALFGRYRRPEITLLPNTRIWNINESLLLNLQGPGAPPLLQAQAVILATGAYDRPAAFPGWTLPGVMSLGAAQSMLKSQRILPGRKILIVGSGPLLLALGAALRQAQGVEVVAVLEGSKELTRFKPERIAALWGQWTRLREGIDYVQTLRRAGVPYRLGWGIVRALGEESVEGAIVAKLDHDWRPIPGSEQTLACDTICIGYGFVPETALGRLAGADHSFQPALGGWVPGRDEFMQTTLPGLYSVGDGAGIGGAAQAAVEGRIAGMAAAFRIDINGRTDSSLAQLVAPELSVLRRERRFQRLYGELFSPGPGLDELADGETIICRCEAIRLAEVRDAVNMGADTLGAVKGLTRAGMGECQGRICGPLLAGQVARLCGKERQAAGSFSPRPPVQPLTIGELAGPSTDSANSLRASSGSKRDGHF